MKVALLCFLFLNLMLGSQAQLNVGFYNGLCGDNDVEAIIRGRVTERYSNDNAIVAGLLRLLFHDCFVNGCDASILLDGSDSEKTAPPNSSVFGYDLVDLIKSDLESVCPGVVSCSDIIVAATRDASVLAGGAPFEVQLGRFDGKISLASDSVSNLPPADIAVQDSINLFGSKGLDVSDMVLLMGGHTVGVTHCSVISDRLYNYQSTGNSDPLMDPSFVWFLQTFVCPSNPSQWYPFVYLDDVSSAMIVDNSYYNQLLMNKGVLRIDQALSNDWTTSSYVQQFASDNNYFLDQFNQALVKLAAVGVKDGTQGEIRSVCNRVN
ncbi:hypothetical protein LUZ60_008973 [Juncus effusus]|nr:hypothetical protein LUZ60_008973 [Juncus effusus]